jgi:hypothetical protein
MNGRPISLIKGIHWIISPFQHFMPYVAQNGYI